MIVFVILTDSRKWAPCVINYIMNSVDTKFTVYSDLPGHTAPGGGSIPPEVCVTAEKPDIVIIDEHRSPNTPVM